MAKKDSPTNEQILENLLIGLLDETAVRDGMRRVSTRHCAGCYRQSKPLRACVAARQFLAKLDLERKARAA